MIDGTIPKQITYVSGPQTLMEIDLGKDELTRGKLEQQLVSPTFVSTTDNNQARYGKSSDLPEDYYVSCYKQTMKAVFV